MRAVIEKSKIFEVGDYFYHGYKALQVEKRTRKGDEIFLYAGGQRYSLAECDESYTEQDVISAIDLCESAETEVEIQTVKELLKMVCTPDMKKEVWQRLTAECRKKLAKSTQE
jgi:hypothetical protein